MTDFGAALLPGRVFASGSEPYERATTPRNARSVQRPLAVVRAHHPDDVTVCVRAAADAGVKVAVQATGHGAAVDITSDQVLLDLSALDNVEVDAQARVVRAGPGATFAKINAAAFRHGLLAPGGTAGDVGVAGYTALGGVGWMTRPHGLASASLLSVDVIDATGRRLHADDTHHDEVLWGWRGGGGVGIATQLELRLFPANDLHAGLMLWSADHAEAIIPAWGRALPDLDPSLTSALGILKAPDAPFVPEHLRGKPVVHLSAATIGGEAAMQTLRHALASLPDPSLDTLGACDDKRLTTIHLDPPVPVPALGTGRWLRAEAGEHALTILAEAEISPDSPLVKVELRHVTAPPSDISGALTSCPGDLTLHALGPAKDDTTTGPVEAALTRVLATTKPVDAGQSVASFCDGRVQVPEAYPPVVAARLDTVRRTLDPEGLISPSRHLK
ncbi:FAD-binding oxidoreductase [Cryptosporangium sp. NPDC051539]|uniref:FAD-binding oxidoreductase n=1 Tax=Cryptosporangium sp. NPDC051539 TaxID=3363962 RepID=UPI0037A6B61B